MCFSRVTVVGFAMKDKQKAELKQAPATRAWLSPLQGARKTTTLLFTELQKPAATLQIHKTSSKWLSVQVGQR